MLTSCYGLLSSDRISRIKATVEDSDEERGRGARRSAFALSDDVSELLEAAQLLNKGDYAREIALRHLRGPARFSSLLVHCTVPVGFSGDFCVLVSDPSFSPYPQLFIPLLHPPSPTRKVISSYSSSPSPSVLKGVIDKYTRKITVYFIAVAFRRLFFPSLFRKINFSTQW